MLGVSMAAARAAADECGLPLYRYLGGVDARRALPVPMMNILNGGAHADNNVDFQEFMVMPVGAPTLRRGAALGRRDLPHAARRSCTSKGLSTGVGDEGGFAPDLKSNEEAVEVILEAIEKAGYKPGKDVAHRARRRGERAVAEDRRSYVFRKSDKARCSTSTEMVAFWKSWVEKYPIVSIEDGLAEDDWDGWKQLTAGARRARAARRRRSLRHQREDPRARHRRGARPTRSWSSSTRSAR